MRALLFSPLLVAALEGCAAIPDLEFAPEDAGASGLGALPAQDGSADAPSTGIDAGGASLADPEDAAAPPPADDASAPPAPPPAVDAAATTPPAPACTAGGDIDACCGAIPCVGKECAGHCDACAACSGLVCCIGAKGKTATCGATAASCGHGPG